MMAGDGIHELKVSAYTIPTDLPESDGTLEWRSTTVVLVEVSARGKTGIGYSYAHGSAAALILEKLKPVINGKSPIDVERLHQELLIAIRNEGQCGLAMMALSAVDSALWDLKSRIIGMPLCEVIGKVRDEVKIYGSGGFTSYTFKQLENQLSRWAQQSFTAVKMKIGRELEKDPERIRIARQAIGDAVDLYVDANGAFHPQQALKLADKLAAQDVSWFEEPVSSADCRGLYFIRQHISAGIRIAAGEYSYTLNDFLSLLRAGATDVLQADATRCGGITGFLKAGQLADAYQQPFSFHCAPSLHLHAALCLPRHSIGEYFHDHVRIEHLLFDGILQPQNGYLKPDLSQPGLGLTLKRQDAQKYRVS